MIDYIKEGSVEYQCPNVRTNSFGKFFSSVGETFANRIPKSKNSASYYVNKICQNKSSLYFKPINSSEIKRLIWKLPNKKSSGYDNIDNILLKQLCDKISNPFAYICNMSLTQGTFPSSMKLADVVPLYKNKERHLRTNYRPISLLITLSKLLEKVVHAQTYTFQNDTGQIFKSQYGFHNNHSCIKCYSRAC